jgi:hypothetical protein
MQLKGHLPDMDRPSRDRFPKCLGELGIVNSFFSDQCVYAHNTDRLLLLLPYLRVLLLPFHGASPVPRGGALHSPACTPSSFSRPPRPACIWPVRRGARLALSLCRLCPFYNVSRPLVLSCLVSSACNWGCKSSALEMYREGGGAPAPSHCPNYTIYALGLSSTN